MNKYMKKILLASMFLLLTVSYSYAEYESTEGYDENTEIRVMGKVTSLVQRARGPVIIVLQTANRDYKVITGPPWYLAQEGFDLKLGDELKIRGSKFIGRDGNVYIVARRIKDTSTGKVLKLMDEACMPYWRGHRIMRGGGYDSQ
jgi:hypothetical protein